MRTTNEQRRKERMLGSSWHPRHFWADIPPIARSLSGAETMLEVRTVSDLRRAISKTERLLHLKSLRSSEIRRLISERIEFLKELPLADLSSFMRTAVLILIRNRELGAVQNGRIPPNISLGTARDIAKELLLDYDNETIIRALKQALDNVCKQYPRIACIRGERFVLDLTVD